MSIQPGILTVIFGSMIFIYAEKLLFLGVFLPHFLFLDLFHYGKQFTQAVEKIESFEGVICNSHPS